MLDPMACLKDGIPLSLVIDLLDGVRPRHRAHLRARAGRHDAGRWISGEQSRGRHAD